MRDGDGCEHRSLRKICSWLVLVWFATGAAQAATPSPAVEPLNLMPLPASVSRQSGEFRIRKQLHIEWSGYKNALLERAGARFLVRLNRRTGIMFAHSGPFDAGNALIIHCEASDPGFLTLQAKEPYELRVENDEIRLDAPGPEGILRGLATLLQVAT